MSRAAEAEASGAAAGRSQWDRRAVLGLLAVIAVTLVVRLPTFVEPAWHDDEGIFASIGKVVAEGGLPYRDAWDNKPPLTYLVYAGWYGLFGPSVAALRAITALTVVGTELAVFGIGRRLWGTARGLAAAGAFGVLASASFFQGTGSFTETFMALPIAGGMLAYVAGRVRPGPEGTAPGFVALAGALLGVGFLFKQVAALDAAALGIFVLLAEPRPWRQAAILAAGWLAAWGAALAAMTATGILDEYLYADFLYYYVDGYLAQNEALPGWAQPLRPLPALVAVGFAVWKRRRDDGLQLYHLVILWLGFAATATVISGRDYPHYIIQALAPMALLMVRPVPLRRPAAGQIHGALLVCAGALVMGLTFVRIWLGDYAQVSGGYYLNAFWLVTRERSLQEYRDFFGVKYQAADAMLGYLDYAELEGRTVYVWADVPWTYALADLKNPTRYPAAYHVRGDRDAEEEVGRDLERNPPLAILKDRNLPSFPELDTFIGAYYMKVDEIPSPGEGVGPIEVYRLRTRVSGS